MIKFFRRIRKKLLRESQFTRYLFYAVGEIVLVVIGILIALGINNWNEASRIDHSVDSHLAILRQNLLEDQNQLRELRSIMTQNIHYADSSLLQIQTVIPVGNQMKKYLVKLVLEHSFHPNTNAIEMLTQANELPVLKTDLQTAILNYYALIERVKEREQVSNTQIQSKYESHLNANYPEVFQKDNGWDFIGAFYKDDPRPTLAIDAEKVLDDSLLEALLVSRYFQSVTLQEFYDALIGSSGTILELIGQEIDSGKK